MKINQLYIKMGLITIGLFAIINVFCKMIASAGFNPVLFTSLSLFFAGLFLISLGGANYNSIKVLKSPATWIYGLSSVGTVATFISLVQYVSSTEAVMVMRLWILVGLVIALVVYKRKTLLKGIYGIPFILAGCVYIFMSIDKESLGVVVFLTILISVIQSVQYFALEYQRKHSKTKYSDLSIMGYILLSTSFLFIVSLMSVSVLGGLVGYTPEFIPTMAEVFDIKMFFLAPAFGVFGFAILRTLEFKTVKAIGADIFMLFTALTPLFTLFFEVIFSKITTLVTPMDITTPFIISNILVVIGSFISTYGQVRVKKSKTLAPMAKNELKVLKETISNTMEFCNDDEDKVAETLGYAKSTIKRIMTSDKPVSKNIRHNIILRHAQHIVGLDHLTGALNQSSFNSKLKVLDEIEKALVMFIDLDKFKPVNDTYGHNAGDSILEGVAERLMSEFNHPHVIGRLGGDEFCAIIYGVEQKDEEKLVKKVKKLVTEPFIVEGIKDEISVGCSIGVAHYPTEAKNGLELKQIADDRMYEDKKANGSGR